MTEAFHTTSGDNVTNPTTDELVQYECEDRIATIRLNRPHKLNAFLDESVQQLIEAMHRFDLDQEADVAVLCGSGRAFSSGADVQARQLRSREQLLKQGSPEGRGARSIDVFTHAVHWKPVVAAVHGYAVGMGMHMVGSSELVVAEAGTKFQITETPRGLGASHYLALLNFRCGGSFATDVVLTGRFFTAEEALQAGLINRVTPKGEYLNVAYDLARQIASNPPLSVRSTVRSRRWYLGQVLREAELQSEPYKLHLTEDFKESARAFVEKRKPGPYQGR